MQRVIIAVLIIGFFGCSQEPTSTGRAIDLFDTEAYIAKEFEQQLTKNVTKTISYNDDREIVKIPDYDITKDLAILNLTNINNPSWQDKYVADTLNISPNHYDIAYSAIDPRLKINKLIVSFVNKEVVGFQAEYTQEALISNSSKRITYNSGEGYIISTTSKNLISDERTIEIRVAFED